MASLTVFDVAGKKVGKYDIDPAEIAPQINRQLLHDVVVMYQASRRQGSHHNKSRGMVSGSKRKLFRQKGTGNARMGSRRSNLRRGGGVAFAHVPRDYSYRLPKKAVRAATRMAIAGKIQDDQVVVVDQLDFSEPKTSQMAEVLRALGLDGSTALIATAEHDPMIYKSARNIRGVDVSPVSDLNAFAVLRPRRMLVTRAALDAIREQAKT